MNGILGSYLSHHHRIHSSYNSAFSSDMDEMISGITIWIPAITSARSFSLFLNLHNSSFCSEGCLKIRRDGSDYFFVSGQYFSTINMTDEECLDGAIHHKCSPMSSTTPWLTSTSVQGNVKERVAIHLFPAETQSRNFFDFQLKIVLERSLLPHSPYPAPSTTECFPNIFAMALRNPTPCSARRLTNKFVLTG